MEIYVLIKTELPCSDVNIRRINFRRFNDRKISLLLSDSCRGTVWTCDGCYDVGSFVAIFNETFRPYCRKYYLSILFVETSFLPFLTRRTM